MGSEAAVGVDGGAGEIIASLQEELALERAKNEILMEQVLEGEDALEAEGVEARAAVAFATSLAGLAGADTTPAARKLLTQASSGAFPFVLADFVEAIGNPGARPEHLRAITERLTATGAHSGADLLAGAVALVNGAIEQEIG